jgi:uncharacterized protein with von Willebrand factor type A (vWA) domain
MLLRFFFRLREVGLPVSLTEYLTLLEALKQRVVSFSIDDFYFLSRSCLVKDERHLDRFDRVFGESFSGIESVGDPQTGAAIPDEWLRKMAEKMLSPEEMEQMQALGGFDKLMERLAELLKNSTSVIKAAVASLVPPGLRRLARLAITPKGADWPASVAASASGQGLGQARV